MPNAKIRCFLTWGRAVGLTPVTLWRHRKKGWINPINIAGRLYITDEEIDRFVTRAQRGEFAKEHKTPSRKMAAAA